MDISGRYPGHWLSRTFAAHFFERSLCTEEVLSNKTNYFSDCLLMSRFCHAVAMNRSTMQCSYLAVIYATEQCKTEVGGGVGSILITPD